MATETEMERSGYREAERYVNDPIGKEGGHVATGFCWPKEGTISGLFGHRFDLGNNCLG